MYILLGAERLIGVSPPKKERRGKEKLHDGPLRSKGISNCQVTFAKTPCPAKGGLWQRICVLRRYFPVLWSSVMTPLSLSLSLSVYIYMHIHIQIYVYIYIPLSRLVSGDLVLVIAN